MVLLPLNSLNSDINNLVYNYKATSIQLLVALFFFHLPTFIFSQDTCEYYYQKKEIADSLKNAEKYSQAFETLTGLEKQLAEDNCWKNWYSCLSAQRTLASYHNYSRMDTVLDRNLNLAQLALPKQKANFYYLASYTYNQRGKVYKSIDYAETALQLYDSLNIQKSKLSMLRNLAINHSHFNDQQSAINYGLALINELPKDDFRNLSRDYNLLATYYLHSAKYQESLLYADSSIYYLNTIPVPENESDKRRFSKIIDNRFLSIKLNQAQAYNYLNNVDLSFKILDNLEAKYGTTQEFLLEKANILEQSGKYQEALRIKEKKFKDYKSLLNNRDFAKEIHSFANTLFLNGELDRALKISQDVIQFFCIDFKDSNFLSNPNKNQIVPEAFLMESLLLKAKILIHKKENEGNQNISPELIFQTFDLSIESLNILRGLFQELDSKLNYSENELNIFADAIAYAMSLYNKDKSKEYFEKAFQYSQLAKSFTLKQSISSRQKFENAKVPKPLSEKYFDLIHTSYDATNNYIALRDSISNLEKEIKEKYFNTSKFENVQHLASKQCQQLLDENTALIDYFYFDDQLYTFLILENETHLLESTMGNLKGHIDEYLQIFHNPNSLNSKAGHIEKVFHKHSSIIRDGLFSNINNILTNNKIDHLAISSMGILKKISVSNLPIGNESSWNNFNNAMINKYLIQNVNSISDLQQEEKSVSIQNSTIVGLDYKNLETNDFLHLPNAIKEANFINTQIGGSLILNEGAQLEKIREAFKDSDLIHYSGHCVVDTKEYEKSYMPIYNKQNSTTKLDFTTLQSYNLQPELVFLSACNTSNGKSLNAEGVLSMARVFTETGAKSVISSNWNTPDKTSYEIVKLYYTFLNEGLSSAEALRAALIKYATDDSISSPSERTPYYWSNWVFTGSDKKLVFEGTKSNNAWMLLALICVAAFLFFIFLKLKQ